LLQSRPCRQKLNANGCAFNCNVKDEKVLSVLKKQRTPRGLGIVGEQNVARSAPPARVSNIGCGEAPSWRRLALAFERLADLGAEFWKLLCQRTHLLPNSQHQPRTRQAANLRTHI
jgi:hypothetical protein